MSWSNDNEQIAYIQTENYKQLHETWTKKTINNYVILILCSMSTK